MQPFDLRRFCFNLLHCSPLQMSESRVSFFQIFRSVEWTLFLLKSVFDLWALDLHMG